MLCVKCHTQIHPLRMKVLPDTTVCVSCSSVKRVGCIPITNHKTGNNIQIVDREFAARVHKLSQRNGYGVNSGVKRRS